MSETKISQSVIRQTCPYCQGNEAVKRGVRKNKRQAVQMYLCKNPECGRVFTWSGVRGKHFPLALIIEALNYYNLGFTGEQTCRFIKQKFKAAPDIRTLNTWLAEYKDLCRYERLRPWAVKLCRPQETVEVVSMAHRQVFRFRYHRPKLHLMLQEFPNRRFGPLREYLDNVAAETPHQYFQEGARMSEVVSRFSKAEMIVKSKFNYANRLADLVLRAVKRNTERHEQLQRFFIANDSVTVATEVPVYIRAEEVEHMENALRFKITDEGLIRLKSRKRREKLPRLLTGHIDLVQVRNGQVHLLDYKPKAAREKPVEQLTWYALALSRLTGLRMFEFKCGWFDERDYFEFYPLHVVYKLRGKKKRKVRFVEGVEAEIPKVDRLTVVPRNYDR